MLLEQKTLSTRYIMVHSYEAWIIAIYMFSPTAAKGFIQHLFGHKIQPAVQIVLLHVAVIQKIVHIH